MLHPAHQCSKAKVSIQKEILLHYTGEDLRESEGSAFGEIRECTCDGKLVDGFSENFTQHLTTIADGIYGQFEPLFSMIIH